MSDPVLDDFDRGQPSQADLTDPQARLALELNDRDNGKRLAAALGRDILCTPDGGWWVWNGQFYDGDGGDDLALGRAAILGALIREELAAADTAPIDVLERKRVMDREGVNADEAEGIIRSRRRGARKKYAVDCGNVTKLQPALKMARPLLRVPTKALDGDRSALQLENGTLDLDVIGRPAPDAELDEEREARWLGCLAQPHRRDHYPTRACSCAFDPAAAAPEFERFINLAFPAPLDRAYVQRCMGMLLGGQRNETVFVLLGEGGNGKSTLVNAVSSVLGGFARTCRIELFLEQRGGPQTGPTPEEAALAGARVYFASEPDSQVTLSAGKIKGLSGGEDRQARNLNRGVMEFVQQGIPVLSCNKMPNVNDASKGFWRRIYPILFSTDFEALPADQQRHSTAVRAALERERAGILNWMIQGWINYCEWGLQPPEGVVVLKEQLHGLSDPVGEFLSARCRIDTGLKIKCSDLRREFVSWAEAEGDLRPIGPKAFTAQLLAKKFTKRKIRGHYHWVGVDAGLSSYSQEDMAE